MAKREGYLSTAIRVRIPPALMASMELARGPQPRSDFVRGAIAVAIRARSTPQEAKHASSKD